MTKRTVLPEEISPLLIYGSESELTEHLHLRAVTMETDDVITIPEFLNNNDSKPRDIMSCEVLWSDDLKEHSHVIMDTMETNGIAYIPGIPDYVKRQAKTPKTTETSKEVEKDRSDGILKTDDGTDGRINSESESKSTHANVPLKDNLPKSNSPCGHPNTDVTSSSVDENSVSSVTEQNTCGIECQMAEHNVLDTEMDNSMTNEYAPLKPDDSETVIHKDECQIAAQRTLVTTADGFPTDANVPTNEDGSGTELSSIVSDGPDSSDMGEQCNLDKKSCGVSSEVSQDTDSDCTRSELDTASGEQDTSSISGCCDSGMDSNATGVITYHTGNYSCAVPLKNTQSERSINSNDKKICCVPSSQTDESTANTPEDQTAGSPSKVSESGSEYHDCTSCLSQTSAGSFSFSSNTQIDSRLEGIDVKVEVSKKKLEKSLSGSSICSFPTQSTLTDFCRICHCEGDAELGPLIAPCRCRGSLHYVHQACLQQWIKSSNSKQCELCGYQFIMDSKLKPFHKWKKLSMTTAERRKIMCSVMFHIIAITCVIWSLYVLIERTANEIKVGQLQWPFWTKLVVVAIGFTGGLVFMYVQCKVYVQLWMRLKAFNRVIYVKNNPPSGSNTPREENMNDDVSPRDLRESVGSLESSNRQLSSQVSHEQVTSPQSSGAVIIEFGSTRK